MVQYVWQMINIDRATVAIPLDIWMDFDYMDEFITEISQKVDKF